MNLFAYCRCDPVNNVDPSGHILTAILIGLAVTALLSYGMTAVGRLTDNEVLVNIGDTIFSLTEIVAGAILIGSGMLPGVGMTLFGTGIGSLTNGLITMSNGGSFHAGWAGAQVSGLVSCLLSPIPFIGPTLGTFAGSLLADLIDSNYTKVDPEKALWSVVVALGLSWLPSVVQLGAGGDIGPVGNFALSYDYALLGIANSIVNVFWGAERNEEVHSTSVRMRVSIHHVLCSCGAPNPDRS